MTEATARQVGLGTTTVGRPAEHGFSAPVTVRKDATTTILLFDALAAALPEAWLQGSTGWSYQLVGAAA